MKLFDRMPKNKESRIGVDIGSYAVKTVEISRDKSGNLDMNNVGYAKVEKPGSKESLIRALKDSATKANVLNRQVNATVSGPSVIIRFIELPRMSKDDLRNAIKFEAEKSIPFNVEEVIIDHQLLIPQLGENKMLVLLVAAKKDMVEDYLNIVNEAGLAIGILDIASLANVNAFLAGPNRKKNEIASLIDIGARATDINIIDEDVLYFTRSAQIGGNDLTRALSEGLSIDFGSAERIKVEPGDRKAEVGEKTELILRNIVDEIRLSFGYYENQFGKNIEKVYLTGGGTRIFNFCDMLKEDIGLEIEYWDPTSFVKIAPSVDANLVSSIKDQLGAAIGLALR